MPAHLEIVIPTPPFAQPRPRAVARGFCRTRKGKLVPVIRVHDTESAVAWKALAATIFRAALAAHPGHGYPAQEPLSVRIVAAFPRPRSEARVVAPAEWSARQVDDADNVAKAVLDAGLGILWPNDGWVSHLEVARVLAPAGHAGAVGLRVAPLPHDTVTAWWWPSVASAPRPRPAAVARARRSRAGRRLPDDVVARLRAAAGSPTHGPGGTCRTQRCPACRALARLRKDEPLAFWSAGPTP